MADAAAQQAVVNAGGGASSSSAGTTTTSTTPSPHGRPGEATLLPLTGRIRVLSVLPRIVVRRSTTKLRVRGKNFVPGMQCFFENSILAPAQVVNSGLSECVLTDETTEYAIQKQGGTGKVQLQMMLPSDPLRFAFFSIAEHLLSVDVREAPIFHAIAPFFGSTYGGTEVTIKGKHLQPDLTEGAIAKCVFFFGRPVIAMFVNDTTVVCETNGALTPSLPYQQEVMIQYLNTFERVMHQEAQLSPRSYNVSTFLEGDEVPMLLSTGLKFSFEPPPFISSVEPLVVAQHDYVLIRGGNFLKAGVKTQMRCRYRLKLDNLNSTAYMARILRMNDDLDEMKVDADTISHDLLKCRTSLVGNVTVDVTISIQENPLREWSNPVLIKVFQAPKTYQTLALAQQVALAKKQLEKLSQMLDSAEATANVGTGTGR